MSDPTTPAVPDPTVEALSEALAEHTLHDDGKKWVCVMSRDVHPQRVLLCRWSRQYRMLNPDAAHRAHVAAVLAARAAAPDALRVRIETLAAEIEDPRTQRPGVQRRRIWAQKLRTLFEDGA